MRVFQQTIRSLVDENYVYARALSYLGVEFYLCPDRKLKDVCQEMGLKKSQVLKAFYLFDRSHRFSFSELKNYPIEIVIEYLKHSHHMFIKEKLPYIAGLVNNYHSEDLKLIFPEFVEEFINHIYEEEDTVFTYIDQLLEIDKGKFQSIFTLDSAMSLRQIHREHREEDELEGIRNLVEELTLSDLHGQVIEREIKAFDREMWYHAEIENKILFPKAIALEAMVKSKIDELTKLN
ncbi:hemerythrin domain-containing protein [Marinoscillum furvescens]|uniref:Regulator of cell morphogenesis and NO signaling n=1 Tax=Marinoscillum furvescens DSM 4134 TaxID=1122208 RepID=A0A3D9L6C9_MARFU|nr:hemerythrin domain-containing protein [Marinoscillum furvescens]RED99571.1 regulator of cell morphogenesis and NO signaling [Marinoscillum furvescens DSM 4134]